MDKDRHRLVKELFLQAGELDPSARSSFLDSACGDDDGLRRDVEVLLDAERDAPGFLEDSPARSAAEIVASTAYQAPLRIGSYRIVRTIAEGGMGIVYEAEQNSPRRRVALKVLKPGYALPRLLERFELEKELLARLQHPGIAQIFDAGTTSILGGTQPWFAMELVDGTSLTEHAEAKRLSVRDRLQLFIEVCDAVHHAHQRGIVHRDLKPANILVTADGQPKVLDFGIARATDLDIQLTTLATEAWQIVGTLPYMSPEQASASPEQVDVRSDVYGLGVVLYEFLTGRLPYAVSDTPLTTAVRIICEQPPRSLGSIDRTLGGDLETILGKALEKDKERRYRSADALAADLGRTLRDEPIEARPAGRLYRFSKFARRNRLLVAMSSTLAVALLVGTWLAIRFGLQQREQRRLGARMEYAARVQAALAEIGSNHVDAARHLLEAVADPSLCGWERRYLDAQLDDGLQQITGLREAPWYSGFLNGPDQAFAVCSRGDVHLWDLTTEERTDVSYEIQDGEDPDRRHVMAVSADGAHVLTLSEIAAEGGGSHTVAILAETASGRVEQRFPVDSLVRANSGASAIAPGGTHVALATKDRLFLYEVTTAQLLQDFELHNESACAFSAQGEWLAYATGNEVHFWDVAAGHPARSPILVRPEPDGVVQELTINADHSLLATSVGSAIDIWDLTTGTRLHMMHGGGNPVFNLVFDRSGSILFSTASGATRLWNPRTGELVRTFPAYERYGGAPSIDPTGRLLAVTHSGSHALERSQGEEGIRIWNLAARQALVLWEHRSYVYSVAMSPDGRLIASGSFDGEVRLWDADSGRCSRVLRGDSRPDGDSMPVHALAFDPHGHRLLVAHRSGRGSVGCVQAWDTTDGALLDRIDLQSTAVAFSPDGTRLLVGDGRDRPLLSLRDGRSLEPRTNLETGSGVVTFSRDGERFATARTARSRVVIWQTSTLEKVLELAGDSPVMSMAFSPDGSRLAVGGAHGRLTIWDLDRQRVLGSVREQSAEVFALVFLGPGRIASGGRDGVIRIWDVSAGEPQFLLGLHDHTDYVHGLALSPDGERLVSGSGDGSVRIWETHPIGRRLAAMRVR